MNENGCIKKQWLNVTKILHFNLNKANKRSLKFCTESQSSTKIYCTNVRSAAADRLPLNFHVAS